MRKANMLYLGIVRMMGLLDDFQHAVEGVIKGGYCYLALFVGVVGVERCPRR